jgi:excisionase family DNA binding protein
LGTGQAFPPEGHQLARQAGFNVADWRPHPQGSGKTILQVLLALAAIKRGFGVIYIDPKGDDFVREELLAAASRAGRQLPAKSERDGGELPRGCADRRCSAARSPRRRRRCHPRDRAAPVDRRRDDPEPVASDAIVPLDHQLLTAEEVAELLRLPVSTIYDRTGRLPHLKIGRALRFSRSDLEVHLAERCRSRVASRV